MQPVHRYGPDALRALGLLGVAAIVILMVTCVQLCQILAWTVTAIAASCRLVAWQIAAEVATRLAHAAAVDAARAAEAALSTALPDNTPAHRTPTAPPSPDDRMCMTPHATDRIVEPPPTTLPSPDNRMCMTPHATARIEESPDLTQTPTRRTPESDARDGRVLGEVAEMADNDVEHSQRRSMSQQREDGTRLADDPRQPILQPPAPPQQQQDSSSGAQQQQQPCTNNDNNNADAPIDSARAAPPAGGNAAQQQVVDNTPKRAWNIGTCNVRTKTDTSQLIACARTHNLDVMVLTETAFRNDVRREDADVGYAVYAAQSVTDDERKLGTGFIVKMRRTRDGTVLDNDAPRDVSVETTESPRVNVLHCMYGRQRIHFIAAYAPTSTGGRRGEVGDDAGDDDEDDDDDDEEELGQAPGQANQPAGAAAPAMARQPDADDQARRTRTQMRRDFWRVLAATFDKFKSGRIYVLGDFNAHVPNPCRQLPANVNGESLLEFVKTRDLVIANFAEHRPRRHVYTWRHTSRAGFDKYFVNDYILCPAGDHLDVRRVRAVVPCLAGADHRIVRARLEPVHGRRPPRRVQPADEPRATVPAEPVSEVETAYAKLTAAYTTAAAAQKQEGPPEGRHPWMTPALWALATRYNTAWQAVRACRGSKKEIAIRRRAYDAAGKAYQKAKRIRQKEYARETADRVKVAFETGNYGAGFKLISRLTKPKPVSLPRTDEDRHKMTSYFASLLGDGTVRGALEEPRPDEPRQPPAGAARDAGEAAPAPPARAPPPAARRQQAAPPPAPAAAAPRPRVELAKPPPPRPLPRAAGEQRYVVSVATDGGAIDNGKPTCRSGFGVHFPNGEHADVAGPTWGPASNNRGEITGLLIALETTADATDTHPANPDLALSTDSMVVIHGVNNLRQWVEADFSDLDHADLWRPIARHVLEKGRRITCTKVKSHTQHDGTDPHKVANDAADALATAGTNMPPLQEAPQYDQSPIAHCEIDDSEPTSEEIIRALRHLHDTSPGDDRIRASVLQKDDSLRAPLVELVQTCWRNRDVPQAFKEAVLVAIPKKPNAKELTDHRGITLLSVAGKVLARILLDRARSVPVLQVQHGFRRANGTAAATFVTRQVMAEARRVGMPLVTTFIDLTKAYDSIPRELLWETMQAYGFGPTAIALTKAMYEDNVRVKLDGKICERSFSTTRGVRQGCLLSPFLFNLVMDRVLRTALQRIQGIPFTNGKEVRPIKARGYADDIALFSRNIVDAQNDIDAFTDACAAAGLAINAKKTEYIRMTDQRQQIAPPPEPAAVQLPRPMQRVPEGYTNAGAIYIVHTQAMKRGVWSCPMCTGHVSKDSKGLRAHLDDCHNLNVNIIAERPKPLSVPKIAAVNVNGTTRYTCDTCANNTQYKFKQHANEHWRKAHGQARGSQTMFAKSTELVPPETARHHRGEERTAHGLTFAKEAGVDVARTLNVLGTVIKRVTEFKYLGRYLTQSCSDSRAIKDRIRIADHTIHKLDSSIIRGMSDRATAMKVYDAIVAAQLHYGGETWTPTGADLRRLDSFQQRTFRRLLGMGARWLTSADRPNYPTTELVYQRAQRPLARHANAFATVRFYGHVLRRPHYDDVRFLLDASIVGCTGLQSLGAARMPTARMRALAGAAGLDERDAATRLRWRHKNWERLRQLSRPAHAGIGDGATIGAQQRTAPDGQPQGGLVA
jgi:ribonuclease HI